MTIVVIPPVRDGSGIPMPAWINVRLVGTDAQNRLAFLDTDLASEYQDVALPSNGLTLTLAAQTELALPDAANSWYRIEIRTAHRRETWLVQVPESVLPVQLRDLVGAEEIPPGSLPADVVADVLDAAAATAADAEATAADRVQTGLDRVATAADRVQTGLDAAATAADRIQTGLDASATAADRIQTGADVIAAEGFASDASDSALESAGYAAFYVDVQESLVGVRADLVGTQAELLELRQDTDVVRDATQQALIGMASDLITTQSIVVTHHGFI